MIKKIKRNLKIFVLFSTYSIKSTFQAKTGIFFFTFGKILRFLMFFLFVFLLVSKTKFLKGYSVDQVLFFYLTYNVIDTASQLLFREVYRFRPLIVSGNFDTILVKPYHPFLRILIGGVDLLDLIMLVPYIILTIFFALKTGGITPDRFITYSLLIFNAIMISAAFHISVLALGILTTEIDHAIMIYRDMTSLGRFPIEIYKEPVRSIFTFFIPVGIMISYPSKALFGLLSTTAILIAFGVSVLLLSGALFLWRFALKRYQSWGG